MIKLCNISDTIISVSVNYTILYLVVDVAL